MARKGKITEPWFPTPTEVLKSKKFQSMSHAIRNMYICCEAQLHIPKARACLYKHAKEEGVQYPANSFVFPAAHMEDYGILRQNGCTYLKELEKNGFIEKVESNKHRKKVNVYKLSNAWKKL